LNFGQGQVHFNLATMFGVVASIKRDKFVLCSA
jgi:hypothetical protein